MDLNVVGRNTSSSPSEERLGKARRLIGFAGRNMLPLIQLGTAGMVGLLFLHPHFSQKVRSPSLKVLQHLVFTLTIAPTCSRQCVIRVQEDIIIN